jgi:hypothetical protein
MTPRARLEAIAKCHAAVLESTGGSIRDTLRALKGEYLAPHLDPTRIAAATVGVPAKLRDHLLSVAQGGITPPMLDRDDTFDVARFRRACQPPKDPAAAEELMRQALARVDKGQALALPRDRARDVLRARCARPRQHPIVFSPCYTVPKSRPGEWRVITDLKWCAGRRRKDSVNAATDFDAGPKCVFGHALKHVLADIYRERLRNPGKPIYVWVVDIADAFRQLYYNPDFAPLFTTVVLEWALVELRGVFGWRLTPGEFDVMAQTLRHLVRASPPDTTVVSEEALRLALQHVRIEDAPEGTVCVNVPEDPAARPPPQADSDAADVHFHVDDGGMVDTRRHLLRRLSAIVFDCIFKIFGYDPLLRECPVSLKKLLEAPWTTRAAFLGVILDTNRMVLELPADKQAKLRRICFEQWPASRKRATEHELDVLMGELRFVAMCVALGKFFLWRLQATRNKARGAKVGARGLVLDAEFHRDLGWWRFLVQRVGGMETPISCPLWHHVKVPPHLVVASDASRQAMGGCCEDQGGVPGWFWCLRLPPDVVALFNAFADDAAVFVNETELAGMVVNAYVVLVLRKQLGPDKCLLLLGDNTSAVAWITKAGTARNAAGGTFVRVLGLLSMVARASFKAQHVAGVENVLPDAISRFLVGKPTADGSPAPTLPAHWQEVVLPPALCAAVSGVLRGCYDLEPWLKLLREAMPGIGEGALAGAPS